jgi:hypothetical protein
MKSKIILFLCSALALTACIDPYGDTPKDEIKLTSDNYLFEGSAEKYHLEERIIEINNELNNKNELHPDYLAQLLEEKNQAENKIEFLLELEKVLFGVFPPPCDQPNRKCVPRFLQYLVVDNSIKEINIKVLNADQELIDESNELSPMPDVDGFSYSTISVPENMGKIFFKIAKTDLKGKETVYFQQLGD